MPRVIVEFTECWRTYVPGDRAAFTEDVAALITTPRPKGGAAGRVVGEAPDKSLFRPPVMEPRQPAKAPAAPPADKMHRGGVRKRRG